MNDIFISYSRHDKEIVLPFVKSIEQKFGAVCWIDLEGIESGSQFEDVIVDTLAADHDEYVAFGKLGKFKAKEVPARDGVSAINGKAWHTDEHVEIVFKLSKTGKML